VHSCIVLEALDAREQRTRGAVELGLCGLLDRELQTRAWVGAGSHALHRFAEQLEQSDDDDRRATLRLRGERQWPSPEALKAQIFKDVARAKRYFRLAGVSASGL